MSNPDTDKPVDLTEETPARRLEPTRTGLPPLAAAQFDVASTEDSLELLVASTRELGDLYRVYAPGRKRDTWICNHPDDIKRLLVTMGARETQIEAVSFGEEKPKSPGRDDAAWAENRRADITYTR